MKEWMRYFIAVLMTGLLVNCTQDEELTSRDYPRLMTLPVTDITSEGAVFNAEFRLRGEMAIVSYGFVWNLSAEPTLENGERLVIAGNVQSNGFSIPIKVSLINNNFYRVKAFVQTANFVVYGEEVTFKSLGSNGPELLAFSPSAGHITDTLRITGTTFGRADWNVQVLVNQLEAEIINFSETQITALLPPRLATETSSVTVSVARNASTFDEPFTLLKPTIDNISPAEGTPGTVVALTGPHFNTEPEQISVFFIGINRTGPEAEIISVTENRIEVRVPEEIDSSELEIAVSMNNLREVAAQKFTILPPVISSFAPLSGKTGSQITIRGENFSPNPETNTVLIDGIPAEIVSAQADALVVRVPDQSSHIYSSRQVGISVAVYEGQAQSPQPFQITDKWFRIANLPFSDYTLTGVSINNRGYVVYPGGMWSFDPLSRQWSSLTAFPDPLRIRTGIFVIGDKIYQGGGFSLSQQTDSNDFWEYDTTTDTWAQKEDFPGLQREYPLAFSIGSYGYLGVGRDFTTTGCCSGYSDVWRYDPLPDSWMRVADHPAAVTNGLWTLSATVLGDEVFAGLGANILAGDSNNWMYKYNATSDLWTQVADYPVSSSFNHTTGVAFTVGSEVFFGSGQFTESLWRFNGSTWTETESNPAGRNGGFGFVIDGIGYFGGGNLGTQFWMFDNSQPD